MEKKKKELLEYQRSISTMTSNMHSIGDRYGAVEMNFYLKRLREITGVSRQCNMLMMMRYSWEHDPRFNDLRETLRGEWTVRGMAETK